MNRVSTKAMRMAQHSRDSRKTEAAMIYRSKWFDIGALLVLLVMSAFLVLVSHAQEPRGPVYTVDVEGIVTSVQIDYVQRALQVAEASDANALIVNLNSEGAVLRAIRPFAVEVAGAEIPVVVYVAPSGTSSGAAGAFLLSAAHIAAMAPDTSFGTPVPLASVDETLSEQTQELVLDSVAEQLREWNEKRERSTAWIDQAVRDGVVRTNEQASAAEPPAIDIIARDQEQLYTLLEGRVVELTSGEEVQLQTLGHNPTPIEPTLWESFLLWLASPTTAFILLVLGAIAIYTELVTPGTGIAAGLGVVLLLGALVGLLVLPVRWISVGGLILAFSLIAVDLFVPTHGGLTVTGLVLMVVSAMTLIDSAQAPGVFVALWAILLVVLAVAAFAAVSIWFIVRSRRSPVKTGQEGMVGRLAEVRKTLDPQGMVFVDGALWRAVSEDGIIEQGDWVRITAVHELRLIVRRIEPDTNIYGGS
jgi:membrane-bound serine protease (ClpP class)